MSQAQRGVQQIQCHRAAQLLCGIKFNEKALATYTKLKWFQKKESVLKVANLTKIFSRPVLDKVTFEIFSGQSIALVGANGAGKCTLLKCLMGLIFPNEGKISYYTDFAPGSLESKQKVAFLPELVSFWPEMTPLEILALCVEDHTPHEKLKEILTTVGLKLKPCGRIFARG